MQATAEFQHPRADRRVLDRAALAVTGVHNVAALLVCALGRVQRVDDAHLVRHFSCFRQVTAYLDAIRLGRDRCGRPHHVLFLRLGIEGVDVAHAA